MNNRWLSASLCVSALIVSAPLWAQEKTYALEMKYTAGEMLKYKSNMNLNMKFKGEKDAPTPLPDMLMKMTSTQVLKVKEIKPDGTAVLSVQMRNGSMEMLGNKTDMPQTPPSTMEISKQGKLLKADLKDLEGLQNNPITKMLPFDKLTSMSAFLPDHPVKAGDKWDLSLPSFAGGKEVTMHCELVGAEMIGGKETLKIKQVSDIAFDMGMDKNGQPIEDASKAEMKINIKMLISGVVNLLAENGRTVKMVNTLDGDLNMELPEEAQKSSPFGKTLHIKMIGTFGQDLLSVGKASDDVPEKPAAKPTAKPAPSKTKPGKAKRG